MVNQQLLDYIKQQVKEGVNNEDIKKALLQKGWSDMDIDEAFSTLKTPTPTSSVPVPPSSTLIPIHGKVFSRMWAFLGLVFLLLLLAVIAITFSYEYFFDLDFFLDRSFFPVLFFSLFTLWFLSEYFLLRKAKEQSNKNLYFYFPVSLAIISVTVGDLLILLWVESFILCENCILLLIPFTPIIFFAVLIYGYIRLFLFFKFSLSNGKILKFIAKNFIKISILFFILYLVIIGIIIFDYKTHGQYLKLSTQSNKVYWQNQAEINNDIALCDITTRTKICQIGFFRNTEQIKNAQNPKTTYNFLLKNQCEKLSKEEQNQCKDSLLRTLAKSIESEVESKLPNLPSGRVFTFGQDKLLFVQIRAEWNNFKIDNFEEKTRMIKGRIGDLTPFLLDERFSSSAIALDLKVPFEEFVKEKTDFYEIFETQIYPIFYTGKEKPQKSVVPVIRKDEEVKKLLDTIRPVAELFVKSPENPNGYGYGTETTSCSTQGSVFAYPAVAQIISDAKQVGSRPIVACLSDDGTSGKGIATSWAVSVLVGGGNSWCVDSSGNSSFNWIALSRNNVSCSSQGDRIFSTEYGFQ